MPFAVARIPFLHFFPISAQHLRFILKTKSFQQICLASDFLADDRLPYLVFCFVFPRKLPFVSFDRIMRAAVRHQLCLRAAFLVAKDNLHAIFDQNGQERGGQRNRRALYDQRIDLMDINFLFAFSAHDKIVQPRFEFTTRIYDNDAKSHDQTFRSLTIKPHGD